MYHITSMQPIKCHIKKKSEVAEKQLHDYVKSTIVAYRSISETSTVSSKIDSSPHEVWPSTTLCALHYREQYQPQWHCLKHSTDNRPGLEKIMILKKKSKKSDFILFKSDFFDLNWIFLIFKFFFAFFSLYYAVIVYICFCLLSTVYYICAVVHCCCIKQFKLHCELHIAQN